MAQQQQGRLTLGMVGDISFTRDTWSHFEKYGPGYLFEHVAADLAGVDIRFGNLESILLPDSFPLERCSGRPLQSNEAVVAALEPLKFDVLHLASNHILDCGWRGVLSNYEHVKRLGALPLGAGPDATEAHALRVVEAAGMRIGFIGYLQAGDWTLEGGGGRVAYMNEARTIAAIKRHRQEVDLLVISYHGDIEFQPVPSRNRLALCRKLAEAGADLIVCHHPHVPQGIEKWGDCLIHYSLGNFLFDLKGYQLNSSPEVVRSHLFTVEIEDGRISGWRRKYYRLDCEEGGRPKPVAAGAVAAEEEYYRNLDTMLQEPLKLRQAWHNYALWRVGWLRDCMVRDAELEPMELVKRYGRLLFSEMSHEYLSSIADLAHDEYLKHGFGDYEFKRPYAPYES